MCYDTVRFQVKRNNFPFGNTLEMKQFLSNRKKEKSQKKGYSHIHFRDTEYGANYFWEGHIGKIRVEIYATFVSIIVSLPKFYHGNNFKPLTRETTKKAILKLNSKLPFNIDLRREKVTVLHAGCVIRTDDPPTDYFDCLDKKPYFRREKKDDENTLYFKTEEQTNTFYDKKQEAADKGSVIPEEFEEGNYLRYESKFKKNPKKQLNTDVTEITGATLYNKKFYNAVVAQCYIEFKKIRKKQVKKGAPEAQKIDEMYQELNEKIHNVLISEIGREVEIPCRKKRKPKRKVTIRKEGSRRIRVYT